jgi:uroporphyrinogen-III synthase
VGEATAMAARAAGFEVVLVGREGAAALVEALLARSPRPRRVLWLRGEEVVAHGAQRLSAAGVALEEVVTYAARPLAGFAEEVRAAPEPGAVLVQSPRAALALADALLAVDRVLPRSTGLYGLGASTAARLRELGFAGAVSVAPADLRAFLAGLT